MGVREWRISLSALPVWMESQGCGKTSVHTATLLETLRFGGGGTGPQGRAGGDRSLDVEWVLEPGETYVFLITNQSGAVANIGFWAFWYEEDEG